MAGGKVELFEKWVSTTGFWHVFNVASMRSLCGVHATDSQETKTPGGYFCRACLDAAAVPADDWRRGSQQDEPLGFPGGKAGE